jgi:hypothetical protein
MVAIDKDFAKVFKESYEQINNGKTVVVMHKDLNKSSEYKFFCTQIKGKDLILISPRDLSARNSWHIDLMNIGLYLMGYELKTTDQFIEFSKKSNYFKNGFIGVLSNNPANCEMSPCILDNVLFQELKSTKEIPKEIQKTQERLTRKLHKIIETQLRKQKKTHLNIYKLVAHTKNKEKTSQNKTTHKKPPRRR